MQYIHVNVATQQRIINFVEDRGVFQRFAGALSNRFGSGVGTKTSAARVIEGAGQLSKTLF